MSWSEQLLQVQGDAVGQHRRVVAAFQDADDSSVAMVAGNSLHGARQFAEVFRFQAERADRVIALSGGVVASDRPGETARKNGARG